MSEYLFADDAARPDAKTPGEPPVAGTRSTQPDAEIPPRAAASRPPDATRRPTDATRRPPDATRPPTDDDDITRAHWPDADDPEQWPVADDETDPAELASGLPAEYPGGGDAEHEAWLASLPADVRADYLAGPYTGAGEVIPPGFTHREPGGPSGVGFAAGGALDRLAPGPWLAQALADVTVAGHEGLGESELIGVLLGCQRQVAWSQARLAAAVSALADRRRAQADRPGWSGLGEHVVEELAVSLTLTSRSASRLLDVGTGMARLTEVAAALETGVIDWPKACILIDELAVLSDELAHAVAAQLLRRAGDQTTGQLRAAVARAVLAADPTAAERRRKEGRKDTRVEVWHEPSGNAALAGRELAPADAITAEARLAADAEWLRDNGAAGTLAELRAAAYLARLSGHDLADLLPPDDGATGDGRGAGGNSGSSDGRGSHPAGGSGGLRRGGTIHLTMPLAALGGLTDAPGEVAGYGTVDAGTCRDLAGRLGSSSRWCLTLTGPDGRAVGHACAGRHGPGTDQPLITWAARLRDKLQLLESGTCRHGRQSRSYAWPTSLRHLIEVRQRTCSAPGCRRSARACDIDHTMPFDQGGPTCECNGNPLCRRHHRAKQAPGWHLTQDQPGVMTWRLPSGRSYQTTGPPYLS